MSYSGERLYEDNVPNTPDVAARINGFYQEIGWNAFEQEDGRLLTVVPDIDEPLDGIGYWMTATAHKNDWFEYHPEPGKTPDNKELSKYTVGLRLVRLNDLRERPLILPSREHLVQLIESGGELLEQHTYEPLREHAGRSEIRIIDPLLFGVRIATPRVE